MKRTIAAILAADVAGYTRLIAEDEEDTLRRLSEYGTVFREHVTRFGGRVFNTAGDAILAEFPSAVEALRAAIAIQEVLRGRNRDYPPARRLQFRMGLTIGDVVERDGDLLGDGVNIAARLEGIAEPGGICLSRSVHEAVSNKVSIGFRDIGPQRLKNLPRPVHALRVVFPPVPGEAAAESGTGRTRLLQRAGALALLLAAVLAGLWFGLPALMSDKAPDATAAKAIREAAERADNLTVSVARAERTCFQDQVSLSGTIVPRQEVELRPDAEGLRVLRVLVDPLEAVRAGQSLAQLGRPGEPEQATVALRTPVSGIVGRSSAVVGAVASAKAPPLFQIIVQGDLELAAEASIATLDKLSVGQLVSVTPLGADEVLGRIRTVPTHIESATQLGLVRVILRNAGGLRQGVFARGTVGVGERCGVGVPSSSIMRGPEGTSIYVVNDNRVEGRPVTTGLAAGHLVEVRDGVQESDVVVLRAGPFLREGDVVKTILASGKT